MDCGIQGNHVTITLTSKLKFAATYQILLGRAQDEVLTSIHDIRHVMQMLF